MGFRLVPKSVTLNDLERRNGPYFALFYQSVALVANCVKVVEDRPILFATKMLSKECSFHQYMTYNDIRRGYHERVHYREAPSHNRCVINLHWAI